MGVSIRLLWKSFSIIFISIIFLSGSLSFSKGSSSKIQTPGQERLGNLNLPILQGESSLANQVGGLSNKNSGARKTIKSNGDFFSKFKTKGSNNEIFIVELKENALTAKNSSGKNPFIETMAKAAGSKYLGSLARSDRGTSLLSRFHRVEIPRSAKEKLEKTAGVVSVKKDVIYQLQQSSFYPSPIFKPGVPHPADPLNQLQWSLPWSGFNRLRFSQSNVVGKVLIFVADTWVDQSHEDFNNETMAPVVSLLPRPSPYSVPHYHGTHVAGIISAKTGNLKGISGALSNAEIHPLEICDPEGCYGSAIAQALVYAADSFPDRDLPRVINLSLGGTTWDSLVTDAVAYAISKNVSVIAASGNSTADTTNFYPASLPGVVSVGATHFNRDTKRLELAYFSNHGEDATTVVAPGQDIMSLAPMEYLNLPEAQEYLHEIGKPYWYLSGTSMAAPLVAASVALLRAEFPNLTNWQIRELLKTKNQTLNVDNYWVPRNGIFSSLDLANFYFDYSRYPFSPSVDVPNIFTESAEIPVSQVVIQRWRSEMEVTVHAGNACDGQEIQIRWYLAVALIPIYPNAYGYSKLECGETRVIRFPVPITEENNYWGPLVIFSAKVEQRDQSGRLIGLTPLIFSNGDDFLNLSALARGF